MKINEIVHSIDDTGWVHKPSYTMIIIMVSFLTSLRVQLKRFVMISNSSLGEVRTAADVLILHVYSYTDGSAFMVHTMYSTIM